MTPPSPQEMLEKSVTTLMEERSQQQINQMQEHLIKMNSALYDKAMAYTNLIIIAGYASAFTIWSLTKGLLGSTTTRCVAVLLLVSIASFVAFETYKMVSNGRVAMSLKNVIKPNMTPEQFNKTLETHTKTVNRELVRLLPVWIATLCVAVPTGFGAAGLMSYAFLRDLFR